MDWNWKNTALMGAGTTRAPLLRACRRDPRCSYYLYLPKGFTLENAKDSNIAAIIHGTGRNAEKLRDAFVDFADETHTVILAPLFPTGIIDREDIHNYKFIKFQDIRFDYILLDMIDEIREIFGIATTKFMLHGFSGGGQFAQRMLYLHPERLMAVSAGAPGRATHLDENEDWSAGTRDFEEQFGKKLDFEAIRKVPVLLLIGMEDTEAVDYSGDPTASQTALGRGTNRLERIRALSENYRTHGLQVQLQEIPGLAHENLKFVGYAKDFFKQILDLEHKTGGS